MVELLLCKQQGSCKC